MVMSIGQWITAAITFVAINAMYFSPIKGCPTLFVIFLLSACCSLFMIPLKDLEVPKPTKAWLGGVGYFVYICVILFTLGGDTYVAARVLINVMFFLSLSSYCYWLTRTHRDAGFRRVIVCALFTAILSSFCQALFNVWIGHLWLLPLQVQNSTDAYAIQSAAHILFGDQNKNIWATKALFTYLLFYSLRGGRWKFFDVAAVALFAFILIYTSCRTAQVAFALGCILHFLYKNRGSGIARRVFALVFACVAVAALVSVSRLSVVNLDISEGAQGDGLLARLILWNYLRLHLPGFTFHELLIGHGVFSVSGFLSPPFEETNLHNVFLNQFYDFGLIGVALYFSFLWFTVINLDVGLRWLIVPALLIVVNSQYVGHDSELIVLYALSAFMPCNASWKETKKDEDFPDRHLCGSTKGT